MKQAAAENSRKSPPPGRPFVKGRSGNPGGRPKTVAIVQELARKHTTAAIAALVDALHDDRLKVPAAQALLDRGWGKAAQVITGVDGSPLSITIDLGGKA